MGKKLKRGARSSTEDGSKHLNMAATNTTEAMVAGSDDEGSDDEASNFDSHMTESIPRATTTNLVFMTSGVC